MALGVTMIEKLPALAGDRRVTPAPADNELVVVFGALPEELATTDTGERAPLPDDLHIVREGETLSSIANDRLGSPALADELARLNDLVDPDHLKPGQRLRLR